MQPKHPTLVLLGAAIRAKRMEAGFAQDEFANLVGLDRGYYGHVERGKHNLSMLNLVKIARGLKVDPGALLPSLNEINSRDTM